ncbi:hypothetical protein [Flavobacterium sp. 22076]|uniref:hypothetical protein n=1 Tax=unclassified Flavobacterium TaxID=196869 RepID=UPI003F8473D0
MNYKNTLFKIICLSFILFQISCKKENNQKNEEVTAENVNKSASVQIAQTYQTDEKLSDDEKLEVKSVIHFSAKYNSPAIWNYEKDVTQGALRKLNPLSNGNLVFLMEEGDGKYNFSPFVLILDKNGKEIFKQNIGDKKSKYNFYDPLVQDNSNGGFTLYVKKEIKSVNESAVSDEAKMRSALAKYQIEKITFKNLNSPSTSISRSMEEIFFKTLQEKGFTHLSKSDFSLKSIKNKIWITGTAAKPNESEIPFIAVLDENFKLLKFNSYEGYPETDINSISLNPDNTFCIEGVEDTAADGSYYSTYKRFIINENLKLLADKSDSKPYSSFYRGPSAPDVEEEEEEAVSEETTSETETNSNQESEKGNTCHFYSDRVENSYYSIKEKEMNSSEILFEKAKSADSTALWQIRFVFPSNYEVPYINSTKGFKRKNGDFVFSLFIRDESVKSGVLSMVIFIFNKEGRLVSQFQTPAYFGLTNFEMQEVNGELIAGFISYNADYVNNNWEYPHVFRSISYPLD